MYDASVRVATCISGIALFLSYLFVFLTLVLDPPVGRINQPDSLFWLKKLSLIVSYPFSVKPLQVYLIFKLMKILYNTTL